MTRMSYPLGAPPQSFALNFIQTVSGFNESFGISVPWWRSLATMVRLPPVPAMHLSSFLHEEEESTKITAITLATKGEIDRI